VIEEERKEGEARPLKTVEQIKEAIADIEKVIAHLEELREVYIRHVFTSMPMGLAITHESVTEDMKNLNLMHFRQRYIRSSLIVMLYELEKQAKGTE
jgi:succinate dehydrogenase/fumarate reductase-like Fe-S protein